MTKEKTKICPMCKTKYGGRAQVCKHCPTRLVYIDGGELVPLVEVAVPPHAHKDITYQYTHIHVYIDGEELKNHCQYASVDRGCAVMQRFEPVEKGRRYIGDETVYGDVELVFSEPTPMQRRSE